MDIQLEYQVIMAKAMINTDHQLFLGRPATAEELDEVEAQVREAGFFSPLGGIEEFLEKAYKEKGMK